MTYYDDEHTMGDERPGVEGNFWFGVGVAVAFDLALVVLAKLGWSFAGAILHQL